MFGFIKWILKKFSCNSSCKYNGEMENCPRESMRNLGNIMDYKLSIKDVMDINKILGKKDTVIHKALTI
tara:strand:+ start:281 stop:487 length:207 start_codon:yes stop_codon:yes gene_type:complete